MVSARLAYPDVGTFFILVRLVKTRSKIFYRLGMGYVTENFDCSSEIRCLGITAYSKVFFSGSLEFLKFLRLLGLWI